MRPKGRVQIIFKALLPNFVKGFNESWHKFHPFCKDESEQNEAEKCSRKPFFL